ncbi:transposable element Tcb2 transposase [Trichonephila clavipes]|nr:transposable element Tcb2 transposase [Trichonephila clavipes]
MDEQLKALLEGINALKNGQEETKERMQNMQISQEETKNELKDRMEKGLENVQKCQEDLKNSLEKKIDHVEEKIKNVEEKIALKVEEKIAVVEKTVVVEEKIEKKDLEPFLETGSADRRPGQGRRRAKTPNEYIYLVLTARRHRNMNAALLQQHLRSATGITVSTQTVRNRLHGVGLYARRPMVCVKLISRHRRDRWEWATEPVNWRRNEWSNVLFSEESRFSVHPDNSVFSSAGTVAVGIILRSCTKVSDLAVGECWYMMASSLTGAQTSTSFEIDI